MRRIRFLVLGLVSFVAAIFGALLVPGTWVNRVFSTLVCGIFSFNSMVCTANWGQSSQRVVAATPPAVENTIFDGFSDLLAQRDPSEFGDPQPSTPSPQQSNPQAPPFPQDPGPNFPVRPEFNNPDSSQPIQQQPASDSLDGTWLYRVYASPSVNDLIFSAPVKITLAGDEPIVSVCENCPNSQLPLDYFASRIPQEQSILAEYQNLTIETVESTDGLAIWGAIRDNDKYEVYFTVGKIGSFVSASLAKKNHDKPFMMAFNWGCIPPNFFNGLKQLSNVRPAQVTPKVKELINGLKKAEQLSERAGSNLAGQRATSNAAEIENSIRYYREVVLGWGNRWLQWLRQVQGKSIKYFNEDKDLLGSDSISQYKNESEANISPQIRESFLITQCISPQALTRLALRGSGLIALATTLAITGIVGEWCIKNPEGCKALTRNPGATARALINTPPQPQQINDVFRVGNVQGAWICDRKKPEGYGYNEYLHTDDITRGICTVRKRDGATLTPPLEINYNIAEAAALCKERLSQNEDPFLREVAGSAFIQVSVAHWNKYKEKVWGCFVPCTENIRKKYTCQKFNPQEGPVSN